MCHSLDMRVWCQTKEQRHLLSCAEVQRDGGFQLEGPKCDGCVTTSRHSMQAKNLLLGSLG